MDFEIFALTLLGAFSLFVWVVSREPKIDPSLHKKLDQILTSINDIKLRVSSGGGIFPGDTEDLLAEAERLTAEYRELYPDGFVCRDCGSKESLRDPRITDRAIYVCTRCGGAG
jgi:DNA-directed RNA polymerase subunit RPC12/RpoP